MPAAPQMVANLKAGNIAGYCVGEPWNERAVETGIGQVLITSYGLWNSNPEKVFGVNLEWHREESAHPSGPGHGLAGSRAMDGQAGKPHGGGESDFAKILRQRARGIR